MNRTVQQPTNLAQTGLANQPFRAFRQSPDQPPKLVHRHVSFDLESFDALKEIQRRLEGEAKRSLTNAEVLRHVLLAYRA